MVVPSMACLQNSSNISKLPCRATGYHWGLYSRLVPLREMADVVSSYFSLIFSFGLNAYLNVAEARSVIDISI